MGAGSRRGHDLHDQAPFRGFAHDHDPDARVFRGVFAFLGGDVRSLRWALAVRPKLAGLDQRERPGGARESRRPGRRRASTQSREGADQRRGVLPGFDRAPALQATGGHRAAPTTEGDDRPTGKRGDDQLGCQQRPSPSCHPRLARPRSSLRRYRHRQRVERPRTLPETDPQLPAPTPFEGTFAGSRKFRLARASSGQRIREWRWSAWRRRHTAPGPCVTSSRPFRSP